MNTLLTSSAVLDVVNAQYSSLGRATHCKLLRRGFNDNYLVSIGSEWYVFRVYFNGKYYIESPGDFLFELELLEYLHEAGIPVARSIRQDNNELLGSVPTEHGES